MAYRVMDLFCGTGGFSKGFENTGAFEVVYGIDLLGPSVETFKLNHRSALGLTGDVRAVRRSDVASKIGYGPGEVDVIIGGPPCQGFSSIRPFRSSSLDDARNNLFEEFAAYVAYFRPSAFVLENVVGLATHASGATIEAMLTLFSSIGYDSDWRILNAAHFGVPQKRERLIMIGMEQGESVVFPDPSHTGQFRTIGHRKRQRMVIPREQPSLLDPVDPLPPALTVADAIDDLPVIHSGGKATSYDGPPRTPYQEARRANANALTLHSSTRHTPKMMEIIRHSGPNISSIPRHLITSGFSSCYSRLAADEPSVTITVNFVHPASNRCIHPTLDRALTPREGARLQSVDDDFRFYGNRTEIVKQIGNAVPPLLGRSIASTLLKVLGQPV